MKVETEIKGGAGHNIQVLMNRPTGERNSICMRTKVKVKVKSKKKVKKSEVRVKVKVEIFGFNLLAEG